MDPFHEERGRVRGESACTSLRQTYRDCHPVRSSISILVEERRLWIGSKDLLNRLQPYAEDLGSAHELGRVSALAWFGPAERQRAYANEAGLCTETSAGSHRFKRG